MNTETLPTAREFLAINNPHYELDRGQTAHDDVYMENMMEEYAMEKAKYYVTEALKAAAENATWERDFKERIHVDKSSILNAYTLEKIK